MARIQRIWMRNYRSIGAPVRIDFPLNKPVILLGQNNAGKSNIIKAVELILGQTWPGTHDPDDHEFFQRDRGNIIDIRVRFDPDDLFGGRYDYVRWRCEDNPAEGDRVGFRGHRPDHRE